MNTINATEAGHDAIFRSWIDSPATDQLGSRRVVIRGWCYHRAGSPITSVRARFGQRTFPGHYGDPRPDVHSAFGGETGAAASGYEIAALFPSGTTVCALEAQLADGTWQLFRSFQATAPRTSAVSDRLKAWHFWTNALLGRPGIWDGLAPDDRDFFVALARHRGWLNLQLVPQYAARPVALERFPRTRMPRSRLPKLTVVTPSYQQANFLEATMRSVLDQPDVTIDYIVQDGGSTDGSAAILNRYAARLKHVESARDGGQADAVVRGFTHMEAQPNDIMMYLNSDDVLMPGAARFVAEYFARHPDVDVVYGHRVLIDDAGDEVGRWFTPRRACDDLRLHDLVPQETLFWRKRIWDRVGGIDRSFHFALDWDLLLRFAKAGATFARVPWFLGLFRLHEQQKSQAWLEDKGIPEMDRLRRRTLGRTPTTEEMHCSMRRAQFDSALLLALRRRGLRV